MKFRFDNSHFPVKPLGDTVEILDSFRRPVNSMQRAERKGDFPYYGANGQVGTIDDFIFDDELILVAEDGGFFFDSIKPIAYRVSGKCWVNNHAHVLKPKDGYDPDWVCYSIAHQDVTNFVNGTTRAKLNQKELKQIPIPAPPLDEQRRIVGRIKECLSRVDEIKRLREETQQEVNALLAASLNEIEKGLSCPMTKVGDIIEDSQNGRSIRSDEINHNGYVLTLSAVRTLELDIEQRKPVLLTDSIVEKYRLKTNDVFISRANTIELVGLASILTKAAPERTIYPDLMIKLTPTTAKIRPKYLALALRFPSVRRQIQYHAKGSSQSMVKISGASLREVAIPLPCLDEQEAIVAKADETRNVTASLKAEFDQKAVDGLTQAILRKAFAGEL